MHSLYKHAVDVSKGSSSASAAYLILVFQPEYMAAWVLVAVLLWPVLALLHTKSICLDANCLIASLAPWQWPHVLDSSLFSLLTPALNATRAGSGFGCKFTVLLQCMLDALSVCLSVRIQHHTPDCTHLPQRPCSLMAEGFLVKCSFRTGMRFRLGQTALRCQRFSSNR